MIRFGERLRKLRHQQQYTQLELGIRIGVAKSTVAGYESGFREPSLSNIISLAKELEVSTDYLLGISKYPQRINDYTPPTETHLNPNDLHWDGMMLEDAELEEIKELLNIAAKRKGNTQQKLN
jgi:transcriptional regulator with XRE-family HTH domain